MIKPASIPLYNTTGQNYAKTRLADPRITEKLAALLNLQLNSSIFDVSYRFIVVEKV